MLLISCHIFYTCHFLLGFMSANTLEADTGNNCMYPKVLSLYETVISICMYPKVLSLYETVISICLDPKVSSLYETVTYAMCYVVSFRGHRDPNGIYIFDPNRASISVSVSLSVYCSNCIPIGMSIYPSTRF